MVEWKDLDKATSVALSRLHLGSKLAVFMFYFLFNFGNATELSRRGGCLESSGNMARDIHELDALITECSLTSSPGPWIPKEMHAGNSFWSLTALNFAEGHCQPCQSPARIWLHVPTDHVVTKFYDR